MKVICVTGMHRSGTSLVTRLVNLLGVNLGPEGEFIPPAPQNPAGFWESKPIRSINERVLRALGGDWLNPPPIFEVAWENTPRLDPLRREAIELLNLLFEDAPVIGWKDPRTSLTLPFWRTVTPIAHTVMVIRHPREVAASLAIRNGVGPEHASELWLRYVTAAWLNDPERILIPYERILEAPEVESRALAEALGLTDPSDEIMREIHSYADVGLRRSDPESVAMGPRLRLAEAVHYIMLDQPSEVVGPVLESLLSRWRASVDGVALVDQVEALLDPSAPEAQALGGAAATLGRLRHHVGRLTDDLVLSRADVADRAQESEALHQQTRAFERRVVTAEEAKEKALARSVELDNQLSEHKRQLSSVQKELETLRRKGAEVDRLSEQAAFAEARARRLESDLAEVREQTIDAKNRLEDMAKERRRLEKKARAAQDQLKRLRGRRSVRMALKVAALARPVFRWRRRSVNRQRETRGRETTGSTLDEEAARAGSSGVDYKSIIAALEEKPPTTVVVPVFNAFEELEDCVAALLKNTPANVELLFINDASTDPRVAAFLHGLRDHPGVRVLTNPENLGFVQTANRGFSETSGDVVLLNSDTEVTPRWLQNLTLAAYRDRQIATATPMSNNAGAFSVPKPGEANTYPAGLSNDEVGRLVSQTSGRLSPDTPTANGFCMYVKRFALDDVGLFDPEAFPRGYGEENDWCMRAIRQGWRHVVDDATLIFHKREASFGLEKQQLLKRARLTLDERYPDYTALVKTFMQSDGMLRVRSTVGSILDDAKKQARIRVLFVLHSGSGGTPATNLDLMRALEHNFEPLVLTSTRRQLTLNAISDGSLVLLRDTRLSRSLGPSDVSDDEYRAIVAQWLIEYGVELVHIRHLFKHTLDLPGLAHTLGIPVVLSFHDFYYVCPTVHLLDHEQRYCAGRCTEGDGICPAPTGDLEIPHLKHFWVHEWRDHVKSMFEEVDAFVTTTDGTKEVYTSIFPELSDRNFEVIEHGRDLLQQMGLGSAPRPGGTIRIAIVGNLGVHKGAAFLRQLVQLDADNRLEFHLLGAVPNEFADVGIRYGKYDREQLGGLLAEIRPAFVGLFSIWAETYSHTLTEAWAAGIPALVSHLGALAERVERHGGGWVVDVTNPVEAYASILRIADSPHEYQREAVRANIEGLPTTTDMAKRYELLYSDVMARQTEREVDRPPHKRTVPTVHLHLVGSPERRPGSAYVRVLQRFRHPEIARRLAWRSGDLNGFLQGKESPDLLLVQRTALPIDAVEAFIDRARMAGIPYMVDLDDNLFDPAVAPDDKYAGYVDSLRLLLGEAVLTTVSTDMLQAAVAPYTSRTEVVPNLLDETIWFDGKLPDWRPNRYDGPLRLLYVGTTTHGGDLAFLRRVIEELNSRNTPVELTVIGGEPVGADREWYTRRRLLREGKAYPRFVSWVRNQASKFDLAVAPLMDTPFNRYKSDLKFLEYSAMGLPGIYSDIEAYAGSVVPGETGYLLPNEADAWIEAIDKQVRDGAERKRVAEAAYHWTRTHRTLGDAAEDYVTLVRSSITAP